MAGTINVNQLIPDPGQDLYINTGQYGANLVVGNATTQILVVTPDGGLKVPVGTTAGRPANPIVGYIRFNTDTQLLENYTANGWVKVSVNTPIISSISGTIYSGNTSTLTINGTNFGSGFQGTITYTAGANTATASATPTSESLITTTVPSTVYGWTAGTSVAVTFTNFSGGVSSAYNMTIVGLPTGGNTITQSGNTRIHTFNSSGTFTVPTGFTATASYLIVAGGGGGGGSGPPGAVGGGGGAGGMRTGTTSISVGSYAVTVGSGGASGSPSSKGSSGVDSVFNSITSTAGGGGGASGPGTWNGISGGSGGGAAGGPSVSATAGSGTPGQGNPGGIGGDGVSAFTSGGGGGGAGAVGNSGPNSPSDTSGGPGGTGVSSSITGSPVYYAGGGGGGTNRGGATLPGTAGTGGTGGGGGGGGAPNPSNATSGTANLGGGGGGSGGYGTSGSGGSGIVIISYTF